MDTRVLKRGTRVRFTRNEIRGGGPATGKILATFTGYPGRYSYLVRDDRDGRPNSVPSVSVVKS